MDGVMQIDELLTIPDLSSFYGKCITLINFDHNHTNNTNVSEEKLLKPTRSCFVNSVI